MLELYDIEMMCSIADIIKIHDIANISAREKCDTMIDIHKHLIYLSHDERIAGMSWVSLSMNDIKQMFKIYNTCIKDKSYVIHIKDTEIIWSQQRDRFMINGNDTLYYSRDDMEELLGYIIHKHGDVISVQSITDIFRAQLKSTQSFANYLRCCKYIKQIHYDIYNLNEYDWFKAQMKLHYSSENKEASSE